jgi:hypothetical protein
MDYKIISVELYGIVQRHVIIDRGEGSFESFPVDETNPRYQQWVADGNTPEPWNPEEQ